MRRLIHTHLISNIVVQHADHRGPLAVRDHVEDFVHLIWATYWHLQE